MFRDTFSSDMEPPSTPDTRRKSQNAPSTTPAGPPPDRSFMPSSTPAGPPPPSLFNTGSQFGINRPPINFGKSSAAPPSSPPKHEFSGTGMGAFGAPTSNRPAAVRARSGGGFGGGFRVPSSSPGRVASEEEDEEDAEGEEDDEMFDDQEAEQEEEQEEEDDEMDEDEEDDQDEIPARGPFFQNQNRAQQSVGSRHSSSVQEASNPPIIHATAKQSQYDLLGLAKGISPRITTLKEQDEVILETERLMEKLHASASSDGIEKRGKVLSDVAHDLVTLWQTAPPNGPKNVRGTSPIYLANQLAGLLLSIHYPGETAHKERQSLFALVPARPQSRQFTPIPKVLIDWWNAFHNTSSELGAILQEPRGYSAHPSFWDGVLVSAYRGSFAATLKLLKGARFEVAETAEVDGLGTNGYSGHHLANGRIAAEAAIKLLEDCPGLASDDWDVKGPDWAIFRQQVTRAYEDLQEFAEGDSQNRQSFAHSFQASSFGMSQSRNNFNLSVASRKAESKVPWTIYENLCRLYNQLLGDEEEILAAAGDWMDAVLGLTIWWNGEENDVAQGSLGASRRSLGRSQRVRSVDVTPTRAYCQRLSASLAFVLQGQSGEDSFSIPVNNPSEVGLACIFDDNIEGVLHVLRGWSLPIASAVAEVATVGEWFRRADGVLDQFDQSDLMVLSFTENRPTGLTKDELLSQYADALTAHKDIRSKDGQTVREGWELAVQVLGRLDDQQNSDRSIDRLLDTLPLDSTDRVDKITQLCHSLGLAEHARRIALKYANHIHDNSQNYGEMLMYYARAHDAAKLQEVLRILVAHCLVKSVAYPPLKDLDENFKDLITSPTQVLNRLNSVDPEAAQLLSMYLSGYATIRKFYDLRDEEILVAPGQKPAHRPKERKRAAANALVVIIASAASSIRGGLYDPEVETVVQVDVLLPLLGEALVFMGQPKRVLKIQQLYSLLAAVEDLDTAPPMIRAQCEECLKTTLAAAHEGAPSGPSRNLSRSRLQQSTSNLTTASSQFSLIGSQEFGSMEGVSTESSAVLVQGGKVDDTKRAWDWRKGFGRDTEGKEVVRVLRLVLAKETARAYAEGSFESG